MGFFDWGDIHTTSPLHIPRLRGLINIRIQYYCKLKGYRNVENKTKLKRTHFSILTWPWEESGSGFLVIRIKVEILLSGSNNRDLIQWQRWREPGFGGKNYTIPDFKQQSCFNYSLSPSVSPSVCSLWTLIIIFDPPQFEALHMLCINTKFQLLWR